MDPSWWLRTPAERLRTTPGDLLLAVGMTAVVVSELGPSRAAEPLLAVGLATPVLLGLAWRRSSPVPVVIAVCLLDLYLSSTAPGPFPPQLMFLAVLLAVYSAAAHTAGRAALLSGASSLAAIVLAHNLTGDGDAGDFLPHLVWGAPWVAGRLVRRQTMEAAAAAEQTAELRSHREHDLRAAQEAERDRIARELHDVVAHAVSLMVVQVGAERLRLGRTAPGTSEVLEAVESTGRRALTDLRSMLGLLRAGSGGDPLTPQPQLTDLATLVEQVRSAGLPVELEVTGSAGVAPALGLSAYRIVQEALTNVVKHAGPVPTRVRVQVTGRHVQIDVVNSPAGGIPDQRSRDGRGLLGMHERAAIHGGYVVCGPEGGGWAVHARLPADAS